MGPATGPASRALSAPLPGGARLALFLAVFAVAAFLRARRAMQVEDADFARLREIRARLGIDA